MLLLGRFPPSGEFTIFSRRASDLFMYPSLVQVAMNLGASVSE
jgi:hypothetical protein